MIAWSRPTLDWEEGGSNPSQETERNGSVSVSKKEQNGRVGKKSLIPLFNFSTSADDNDNF